MNTLSVEEYSLHFSQSEGETCVVFDRGESEVWRIRANDIKVISYYKGKDGDHAIEMIVFIDSEGNRYPLDLRAGIRNCKEVLAWLDENFGYQEAIASLNFKEDSAPKVIYPQELRGKRTFDRSLTTFFIRLIINAGYGVISNRVNTYLRRA